MGDCKKCGIKFNYSFLASKLGSGLDTISNLRDVTAGKYVEPIPSIEVNHKALLEDEAYSEVLDYLVAERKLSIATLEQFKIGVQKGVNEKRHPNANWIAIPYTQNGNVVNVKYRTSPPTEKDFKSLAGRDMPLYNSDVLKRGLPYLILVEGEIDTLTLVQNGFSNVVGVPGANTQKTTWIKKLDEISPDNIYTCLDNDEVGQKAAKELATKIDIDKCKNIILPVKDPNEFFATGGTAEQFQTFMDDAKPFEVDGVQNISEVITELIKDASQGKTEQAKYISQWAGLNARWGGTTEGEVTGILSKAKMGKTLFTMNLTDFWVSTYEEPGMIYCIEMNQRKSVNRWISYVTDSDISALTPNSYEDGLAIANNRKSDLYFAYTNNPQPAKVFDTIRQAKRRYGIKFLVFDNLHLLCRDTTTMVQATTLAAEFKHLCMELGLVMLLVLQPKAVEKDSIVSSDDIAGSSMLKSIVDSLIVLHRNKVATVNTTELEALGGVIETNTIYHPEMLTSVELSRYASGGRCMLEVDGARSRIKDYVAVTKATKGHGTIISGLDNQYGAMVY